MLQGQPTNLSPAELIRHGYFAQYRLSMNATHQTADNRWSTCHLPLSQPGWKTGNAQVWVS
jgi:hypothetical protein